MSINPKKKFDPDPLGGRDPNPHHPRLPASNAGLFHFRSGAKRSKFPCGCSSYPNPPSLVGGAGWTQGQNPYKTLILRRMKQLWGERG